MELTGHCSILYFLPQSIIEIIKAGSFSSAFISSKCPVHNKCINELDLFTSTLLDRWLSAPHSKVGFLSGSYQAAEESCPNHLIVILLLSRDSEHDDSASGTI